MSTRPEHREHARIAVLAWTGTVAIAAPGAAAILFAFADGTAVDRTIAGIAGGAMITLAAVGCAVAYAASRAERRNQPPADGDE